MQPRQPIPVRDGTRDAMHAEPATPAQGLFAGKGYEQTTIEDPVAAAGPARRRPA